MVWALRVVDQQATLTTVPVLTQSLTVEIDVKFENFDNSYNNVLSNSQTNAFADDCFQMGCRSDGKPFVNMGGVGSRYLEGASPLSTGVRYKIRAEFTNLVQTPPGSGGGNMELFVDEVSVDTGTPNSTPMHSTSDSITFIGAASGFRSFDGYVYGIKIIGDTFDYQWSADSSSHAAGTPTLVSTVDQNDFVGNNLPTDGTAWVEEGGDVTPPVYTVAPSVTATTSVGHTFSQTINEDGIVRGVRVAAGATPAPLAAQIQAGNDGNDNPALEAKNNSATADVSADIIFNGGDVDTEYDHYFIAQDSAGNLMADGQVVKVTARTSGVSLTLNGDLNPGQTVTGVYAGISDLARVVITDSKGNTLDTDVAGGPTLVDNLDGTFSLTMPTLPETGTKQLLVFGTTNVIGYPAP